MKTGSWGFGTRWLTAYSYKYVAVDYHVLLRNLSFMQCPTYESFKHMGPGDLDVLGTWRFQSWQIINRTHWACVFLFFHSVLYSALGARPNEHLFNPIHRISNLSFPWGFKAAELWQAANGRFLQLWSGPVVTEEVFVAFFRPKDHEYIVNCRSPI